MPMTIAYDYSYRANQPYVINKFVSNSSLLTKHDDFPTFIPFNRLRVSLSHFERLRFCMGTRPYPTVDVKTIPVKFPSFFVKQKRHPDVQSL